MTAQQFIDKLKTLASPDNRLNYERYFKSATKDKDIFLGVRMGHVFNLAKEFADMPLGEIEKLLDSPLHEARVGAVSIMDYHARRKSTPPEQRKAYFDLYLRRHDRINTWDLVDRASIHVIGGYLADKPRDVLYKLAKSKFWPERRTAIVATAYFMMKLGQTNDTFKIADLLLDDMEDLMHKATGWMLRVAGDKNRPELIEYLNKHATKMPRVMLRNAIEKFPPDLKKHYMALKA